MPDEDLSIKENLHKLLIGVDYECKAKYDDPKRKLVDSTTGQDLIESDGVYYHLPSQTVIYTEATTQDSGITDYIREKHRNLLAYHKDLERQVGVSGNVLHRILLVVSDKMPGGDTNILDQTNLKLVVLNSSELENYYLYLLKVMGKYLKYEFDKAIGIKNTERPRAVQAIEVNLSGHTVYVFELTVEEILKTCYAFRKKDVMDEGYQRLLDEKKLNDLNNFLKTGQANLFPNSILINLHNHIEQPNKVSYGIVEFKYPMESGSFNIIDGQHRVYGYCKSGLDLSAQRLIVVGFKDIPDQSNEIRFFLKINRKQKPIDPTLRSLLMAKVDFVREENEFWESRSSKLAYKLSEKGFYKNDIYKGGIVDKKNKDKATITSMARNIDKTFLLVHRTKKKGSYVIGPGWIQKTEDVDKLDPVVNMINDALISMINGIAPEDRGEVKKFILGNRGFSLVCRLLRGYFRLLEEEGKLSLDLNQFFAELKFNSKLIDNIKYYYGEAGMSIIADKAGKYIKNQDKFKTQHREFRKIDLR